MGSHNPMRGYLDIIIKECPTAEYNEIRQQSDKTAGIFQISIFSFFHKLILLRMKRCFIWQVSKVACANQAS